MTHMPAFWAAVSAVVLAIGAVIIIWNLLISLRNDIRRAWANIDVILQQRHDELGNLVAALRDYMAYEQKVLVDVTEARNRLAAARSVREKAGLDQRLRTGMRELFAVVEGYPDIKSNHLVLDLMRRITELENSLADRREMYNNTVTQFNTMIAVFPIVMISGTLGFAEESLFSAEAAARVTPKIALRG